MWARIVEEVIRWFRDLDLGTWIGSLIGFTSEAPPVEFRGAIKGASFGPLGGERDVKSAAQFWFPSSASDVAAAVARTRHLKTFIRSGTQAAVSDVVDATGGVVINLAALKDVSVTQGLLNAQPAATLEAVTEQLAAHGLALPLIDNRRKSIAGNLMSHRSSALIRTLGSLPDYLSEVDAVTAAGEPTKLSGPSAIATLRAGGLVITNLIFKAAPADPLWMVLRSFPFPGKEPLSAVLKALFVNSRIPPGCDVVLDAVSARHDVPLIRITATGAAKDLKATVVELVDKALALLPAEYFREIISPPDQSGPQVIRSIVEAGHGIPVDAEVETRRVHSVIGPSADRNAALDRVAQDVERGLSFRADRTGKTDKHLRLYTRVQLDREDRLELSGLVYTRRRARTPVAPLASFAEVRQPDTPLHSGAALVPVLTAEGTPPIPGFQGDVYKPSDLLFDIHALQYATSSFPKEDMTPFMLAYPTDVADIQAAIAFARSERKSIVARSGGHQYSGLSSGGDGTIVLSMDAFNQFEDVSENVVDVGPAVQLTVLAARFDERGITIPHGECPLVCVGGHLQTGGYGHFARGFGLALDYVKAFTIVLADGSVRTINRPSGAPVTSDDEIFWGVLGGNAGSFGIITNYRIECVKNVDHPHSYGFKAIRKYDKARYLGLMKEVQKWTQQVAAAGPLPQDIDFMMTVESSKEPFLPPLHLVELVYSNSHTASPPLDGDAVFAPIIAAADEDAGVWSLFTTQGPKPLSELADSFVRRFPETTLGGREFEFPYKKRINCTTEPLTDPFVQKLVDLVDQVVTSTPGVYLVFQMMIGGGSFRNSDRRLATSIPRRDSVFTFVFDLFYEEGMSETAVQLQNAMQQIIDADFNAGQEGRLFWGCFGDVNITEPAVRACYYDDATRYTRLQHLKQQIDPTDIFHSPLTVKLPGGE